mgnify:CR=1 FL=1
MLIVRYILKSHVAPFVGTLGTILFLFVLQFLMKAVDQLVGKGLSIGIIAEFIVLNLAWMLVLAVPMAVLVSTLMAFGGMASTNEITAMKASGISIYKLMFPPLLCSIIIAYLMIQFNNKILPEANHRSKTLRIDIQRKKPTLTLVPGLFSQELPGYSILVRKTFPENNELEGVIIYDYTTPNKNTVITAKRGALSFSSDYRKLLMDLYDGEIHELSSANYKEYRKIEFQHQRLATTTSGFDFSRSSTSAFTRGDREMNVGEMLYVVDSLKKELQKIYERMLLQQKGLQEKLLHGSIDSTSANKIAWEKFQQYTNFNSQLMSYRSTLDTDISAIEYFQKTISQYLVEIHKKYALSCASIIFIFVGVPLGVMAKKGGFGMAASLSLLFFVIYWACLMAGEQLADREILSSWLGMWLGNIVVGIMGIVLTIQVVREKTLPRFDWLTRWFTKRKIFTKLFRE